MRLQISLAIFVAGLAVTCLPLYGQDPGPDEVIGVTGVVTPYSSQVQGYGFTEMGANVAYYYDAYVEVYLSQNNSPLESGASPVDNPVAGGYLPPVGTAPDSKYEIVSNHYLVAYFAYYDPSTGYPVYGNPEGFLSNGGDFGNSTSFDPGGPATYITSELLYLGSTGGEIDTTPPNITGLYISGTNTPAALSLNTSGSLDIRGDHLTALGLDLEPEIGVSDSGITLQLTNPSDAQLTVSYTVAGSTQPGPQWLNVTTNAGVSNSVNFNVGDATPSITSISPNVWNAGSVTSFTITGTGFGTNPSLTVTGTGVTGYSIIGISNDTTINASVTVDGSAPSGNATVTVQSNGYGGSGFQQTQPGQPATGSQNATIQGAAPPIPQLIFFSGGNVAGTTLSVVVGQQIQLTAQWPAGVSVSNPTWSQPPGTAVADYIASTSGGSVTTLTTTTSSTYRFYWADAGNSRQITYSYIVNGQAGSVFVAFNVDGPSGVTITPTSSNTVSILSPGHSGAFASNTILLDGASGVPGVSFVAQATHVPAGIYQWVQLISSDKSSTLASNGPHTVDKVTGAPALDLGYPYGYNSSGNPLGTVTTTHGVTNDTSQDSPYSVLPSLYGELARYFTATMYVMWVPPADPRCNNGIACTIPAPIGSISWKAAGDAINTLQPWSGSGYTDTVWVKSCQNPPAASGFQTSSAYPTWSTVI